MIATDEYLVPNASFIRLYEEYKKYGSIVVAFDFDNTVYDFHKKGATYFKVMTLLRELDWLDCILICFTANSDLPFIKNYLDINKIPYDYINQNPPFFKSEERKIYYNVLLDDRAGLLQVYTELDLLVKLIKKGK